MGEESKDLSELSDSILNSVKKLIGINEEDTSFDLDIIFNINAAILTMYQLGIIKKAYTITSKDDTYQMLMPDCPEEIVNQTKMYFVYKVRLGFDSSTLTANMVQVIKDLIAEAEYRMMIEFNPDNTIKSEERGEIQNDE